MAIDWSAPVQFAADHERFIILTHTRPDGDAIGSQVSLALALRALGKTAKVVTCGAVPPKWQFMATPEVASAFDPADPDLAQADAVIVVDTGTWNQLAEAGEWLKTSPVARITIDHHRTQDDLGGPRYVDISAEANTRLVHEFRTALGAPLTPEAATALFVGLATDTGWFRHANTRPETFRLAGDLMAAGADPNSLYDQLFERSSPGRLRLVARALERLELLADGKIAVAEVRRSDYPETGAVPGDSEDLIGFPRSIRGVEVAVLFMEQPRGGVKVSFRSKEPHDVSRLAEQFGGGGHRLAAGATLPDPLSEARAAVLAKLSQLFPA